MIGAQPQFAAAGLDGGIDLDVVTGLDSQAARTERRIDGRRKNHVVGRLHPDVGAGRNRRQRAGGNKGPGACIAELVHVAQRPRGGRSHHFNIHRVEQPGAVGAVAAGGIDDQAVDVQVFARRFHQAACAAACRDQTERTRVRIAPQHHGAALAGRAAVGHDGRILGKQGLLRIAHQGIFSLVAAAEQHTAAVGRAADIDAGVAGHTDPFAFNRDRAAIAGAGGAGDAARFEHRVALGAQHDLAVGAKLGAVGVDHPALVDQRPVDANLAALRDDLAQVDRLLRRRRHDHVQVRVTRIDQPHAMARRQHHLALGRGDDAIIRYAGGNQVHLAAGRRADAALVDDLPGNRPGLEVLFAAQEIRIRHAQGRGRQAAHVDARIAPEHDAVRVNQEHVPVRLQRPQDLARVLPQDAVEHGAVAALLDEAGHLACIDIEALPVDHRIRRIGD